ncbi:MAG: peptidoglycan-binding protein [Frankiaceae bacterium]|nr:peptidoglycan-binding protein [Frankiaceae bacterium]MBV9368772.1 peptidoglycan-binding protein [Frankiales bacterium]
MLVVRRAAAVTLVGVLGFASFAAAGPSAPPAPTADCAAVAVGSHGPAVQTLQRAVGATPDGDFGPQTKKAVSAWQSAHKIKATGVVDAATWKALPVPDAVAACRQQVKGSGVTPTCTTLTRNDTGPAVAVLQNAIRATGPKITIDAQYGDQTRAAVVALQTARKLKATGVVDAATWASLGLTGTPACILPAAPVAVTTPAPAPPPSPDAAAQAAIRAQVVKLAAALPSTPGTTASPVAKQAIAFAKAQAGKPYKWGATGPASYDCSGLVLAAYQAAGITTPRVAADQYGTGVSVPLDKAQAGDLLFYASDVAKPATIYHVVMYLGAGQIIDAPYTGAYVGTRALWTQNLLPVAWRPVASLLLPTKPGATGWTVAQLQQALDRHGAKLTVDGGYGSATLSAVKSWQQAHKQAANGVVDVPTWLTLG